MHVDQARELLVRLGAPERLIRHVELVGEAAEALLSELRALHVPLDPDRIRVGVVLHDVGKVLHPAELERAGRDHEEAGRQLLLREGVDPDIARICVTHARWAEGDLEDRVVALADKLWKGVRTPDLEAAVIDEVAGRLGVDRWAVFGRLDDRFERIADDGVDRLQRSQ
jgi:putative nucleotidyltransferase with HDIG domain